MLQIYIIDRLHDLICHMHRHNCCQNQHHNSNAYKWWYQFHKKYPDRILRTGYSEYTVIRQSQCIVQSFLRQGFGSTFRMAAARLQCFLNLLTVTMIFHSCSISLIIIENRSVFRNIGDTVIFFFDLFQIIYTILLYTIYQISCFFFQLSIDLFSKMLIKDCHNTCNPKNQYSRSYQYA